MGRPANTIKEDSISKFEDEAWKWAEALSDLADKKVASRRKIAALTSRVEAFHTKYSFPVDGSSDADLTSIMATESGALQQALPNDSSRSFLGTAA